jgi:hypothetical protein
VFSDGDVHVADDHEMKKMVVGLTGSDALIEFSMVATLPLLILHLKNEDAYISITVTIKDADGLLRTLVITNKRSTIFMQNSTCEMPLVLTPGWNYVKLDLIDITRSAFGAKFISCRKVQVSGNGRFSKIFFEDREYSDIELPPFLRVVAGK